MEGGLEIAAMTGMALEAARQKLVIVADGFISTAAVALAAAIEPKVGGYIVAGHRSEEKTPRRCSGGSAGMTTSELPTSP